MAKTKWYNNSKIEILLKDSEPIPEGFVKGRLPKPKKIDILKQFVSKEDLYQKFIIENIKLKDLTNIYNLSPSDIRQLLNHYNIHKDPKLQAKNRKYTRTHEQSILIGKKSSETQKKRWLNKTEQEKQDWANYCRQVQNNLPYEKKEMMKINSIKWYNELSEKDKLKVNEQRRQSCKSTWTLNGDEIQAKRKITEKINRKNRLCRSNAEQLMYNVLTTIYEDVQYDVKVDDRYPYYCDFYIPCEDLFIELNAHPSHGRLPYSELLFEEYNSYPNKWVDVFARRDVEKQSCAKENHLNYIMIYPEASLEDNIRINHNHKLVELLYNSQK